MQNDPHEALQKLIFAGFFYDYNKIFGDLDYDETYDEQILIILWHTDQTLNWSVIIYSARTFYVVLGLWLFLLQFELFTLIELVA